MRSRTVTVNCQAKCDSTRVTQVGRNLWRCAAGAKKFGDLCAHMRVVAEDARADCFFWIAQRKSPKIALAQPSLALHLAIPRKFRMFWTWEVAFQILKALLEHFPTGLNRLGFPNRGRSDSSCILAKGASMHGQGFIV